MATKPEKRLNKFQIVFRSGASIVLNARGIDISRDNCVRDLTLIDPAGSVPLYLQTGEIIAILQLDAIAQPENRLQKQTDVPTVLAEQ